MYSIGVKDRVALHSSRAVLISQVILKAGVSVHVKQVAFMSPNMSVFFFSQCTGHLQCKQGQGKISAVDIHYTKIKS